MKICLVCEGISATEQAHCSSCGLELVQTDEVHFPVRRGEDDAAHPLLGALVGGKYRVTNVLGKGGMGTVFRATHEVSLVPVALKILHPRFAEQEDYRRSFLAEARKAGSVIHEHSARILDVGEQADGTAYIAMELVHGVTLDEWFRGGRPLAPAHVVDILQQVCEALAVAHAVGVVHRDLSPRNIMGQIRDGRPSVKILDFGIARAIRSTAAGDVLPPGAFASPPYSAPEHLQGLDVDTRADLYSLGVLAYQALTGEVPVSGTEQSEWIRATIDGRLRPLRAPSGTPSRLIRLIERLLSRDPDRRPSTPGEVIAELEHIRRPRGQWLRAAALLLLVPSTASFLLAHLGEQSAFLRPRPGSKLRWSTVEPAADQVAVQLRSEEMRQLSFDYGGFDGRALQVTAYHGKVPLQAGAIEPILVGVGELRLSAEAATDYDAFLQTLATIREPVVLVFGVPGRPPLGYAKVLIDNEAPVIRLDIRGRQPGILAADSELVVSIGEHGWLRTVELAVVRLDGAEIERFSLPAKIGETICSAKELLGGLFPGVTQVPNVNLELRAVDQAGNRSEPVVARCAYIDFAAPRIVGLGDRERLIAYRPEGADFVLRLDASESNVELTVRRPGGRIETVPYRDEERQLRLTLSPESGQPPFAAGAYTFELRDSAGNSSSFTTPELTFRSSALDAQLTVEDPTGAAVVIDRRIVSDGRALRLRLRCNSLYRPAQVELVRRGGEAVPTTQAGLAEERMGEAWLQLGALTDGDYRIGLTMVDREGLRPTRASWDLDVIAMPMELRLPDTTAVRFLQQLLTLDVVRVGDDGRLAQGFTWSLVPPKPELLRGSLWSGHPGSLKQSGLRPAPSRDRGLFDEFQAIRGENVVAVELFDVLRRPVRVTIGGGDAPVLRQPDGRELREVARFFHSDVSLVSGTTEINVEYEQPTRVPLRVRLPLRPGDDVQLLLQARSIACSGIAADGEGAVLTFNVPFEALAQAASLLDLSRERFLEYPDVGLTATLRTPAGDEQVGLRLHPALSTLQPLSLDDLAVAPSRLPPALGAIRMTPIVGPGLGAVVQDPVPGTVRARETFRPLPSLDVRNLTQAFVQEGEMTRMQYREACRAFDALPSALRPPWKVLVHAADPLHERRLQHLLPAIYAGDDAAFAAAVRLGPDRPVTGVSFFQAYAVARLTGFLLAGDPGLLRLPMGLELEVGALGFGAHRRRAALNGVFGPNSLKLVAAHRDAAEHLAEPGAWPPTAAESERAGDVVRSVLGFALIGLDFGVREWVFDLPYVGSERARPLLEEWLRDYAVHLERARALARGEDLASLGELAPQLGQLGVVRGLALGELRDLIDAVDGRRVDVAGRGGLPPTVPGVVRGLVLRRDGKGLLGALDPHLQYIGFRLAGGAALVAAARRQ